MFLRKILLFAAAGLILASCEETPEDETTGLKTQASIELTLQTEHLNDSQDVLRTVKNVYDDLGRQRTITTVDTIPGLGTEVVEGENEAGEIMRSLKKKDYEFFVTIK